MAGSLVAWLTLGLQSMLEVECRDPFMCSPSACVLQLEAEGLKIGTCAQQHACVCSPFEANGPDLSNMTPDRKTQASNHPLVPCRQAWTTCTSFRTGAWMGQQPPTMWR